MKLELASSQLRLACGDHLSGLAFHRATYEPCAFAATSPFHFKAGGYISELLTL